MLLERLADELGREARALVAETLDLVLAVTNGLVLVGGLLDQLLPERSLHLLALEGGGADLPLELGDAQPLLARGLAHGEGLLGRERRLAGLELLLERGDLAVALRELSLALGGGVRERAVPRGRGLEEGAVLFGDRLVPLGERLGELALGGRPGQRDGVLAALDLGAELGELRVLLGGRPLGLLASLGDGRLHGARALALRKPPALRELPLELRVAHLAHDLRVLGLVDLEHLSAVRASDLCHGPSRSSRAT